MICLFVLPGLVTCSSAAAQSLAAEDRYLRRKYEAGTISLDRYRRRAESLRDAALAVGGYPELPVDSLGRYSFTTVVAVDASAPNLWESVSQWFALTGYVAEENLQYSDPETGRRIVKLVGTFRLTDRGRQSMAYYPEGRWGAATVECVLDLAIEAGRVTAQWLRPAVGIHSKRWPMEELVPVTRFPDNRYNSWEDRLHRSKVMHEFVQGLAADMEDYLARELPKER
ncbi:hypothetical protein [Neolewinella litorea]|uniref:DUF4468 domain-containing protein n=1 Tax=Neolewinella litorea TaxID=2562452 RepID=A0A4S4NXP3_9BACT|nr:hypothetical protein [Neolewinella litorea]THH41040.1 hypothetical protein E4021_00135 [Neolewinella litorea]